MHPQYTVGQPDVVPNVTLKSSRICNEVSFVLHISLFCSIYYKNLGFFKLSSFLFYLKESEKYQKFENKLPYFHSTAYL